MRIVEWMSVNPCKGCSISGKPECQSCNKDKDVAIKLLLYLITHTPNFQSWQDDNMYNKRLKSMLKQLEEK
jgi:hypothetical protein